MPARNIHLTTEWESFVSDRVQSGQYANASEVVRAGLRALEQDEAEDREEQLRHRHHLLKSPADCSGFQSAVASAALASPKPFEDRLATIMDAGGFRLWAIS